MRLPLVLFLVLPVYPETGAAESAQSQGQIQSPTPRTESATDQGLLRDAFQAQFNREQLGQFKTPPTLEQLIQRMSPEQRQGARARLGELEPTAKTPEDLKEVARGYLLLDEHAAEAGQGAVRVAERLRELEPEKSDGFTLTASGFHQMGDYPAATQWAREALKRDPHDQAARAVFLLSVGRSRRGGSTKAGVAAAGASENGGSEASAWSIPEAGVSPEALDLMRQAVVHRRTGDMDKTFQFAQAAMRADPASAGVQKFYRLVAAERVGHADAVE